MAGDEGLLTLSIGMRVSPEPIVIELLKKYRDALNYSIEWIVKNSTKNGKRYRAPSLSTVHKSLYKSLKKMFNLPSRIALDCYREALAIAKSYLGNNANGRIPKTRKLRMWLTYGYGYRIKNDCVEIIGGLKLKIVGWDKRYDGYKNREARLVYRDNKMFLMIAKRIPKPKLIKPKSIIAVDINEAKMVYGNKKEIRFEETAIDEAYRYVALANRLQEKYSSPKYQAWLRRRNVLMRIKKHHRKARNILTDWARKVALNITRYAFKHESAVAIEDLTNLIKSLRKLHKTHKTKLIIMGYRRLLYWIKWQAEKNGIPVETVNPRRTSSMCPICGAKLHENGYRKLKCPNCGFEENRDVIAVLNIEKRVQNKMGGYLITPTALHMTDVIPNRCGEPMNRPRTFAL